MLSGTLKDLAGKPLTGPVDLNFAIYKEQADAAPLWQESQTLNADEQGHYTALLGAMQPEGLPVDLFTSGEARWLGVSAGKLPEQPRVLLVSVPYALKANDAEMLAGKPASAYALAPPAGASTSAGTATAGTTAPSGAAASELATPGKPKSGAKPNFTETGNANYIPMYSDASLDLGNSAMYQSSGKIGMGTTSPGVKLDVLDNGNATVGGFRSSNPSGANLVLTHVGASNPDKYLRSFNGSFQVINSAYSAALLTVQDGGKVGIGTTTPAFTLDVNGNTLAIGTNTARAGYGGSVRLRDDTGTQRWSFGIPGSAGATGFFVYDVVNATQPLFIEAAVPSYSLYLKGTTGNVGIGMTTPAHRLDVAGDINASTNIKAGGNLSVTGTLTGNGSGLTALNASNLASGTVPSARISGTYSNALMFSSASNSFTGNGSGLTGVAAATATTASGLSCTGCVGNTQLGVNYAASASKGGPAANALLLSGLASTAFQPAGSYATIGANNTFTGNYTVTGNLSVSGTVNGMTIAPNSSSSCTLSNTLYTSCNSVNVNNGATAAAGSGAGKVVRTESVSSRLDRVNKFGGGALARISHQLDVAKGNGPTNVAVNGETRTPAVRRPDSIAPRGGKGTTPQVVAGNTIASWVLGGTIAGGGGYFTSGTVVDDESNTVTNNWGTVGGGAENTAGDATGSTSANCCETVGGGLANVADGDVTTIAGGFLNTASGDFSTVGGGGTNTAGESESGGGLTTVAGGGYNIANGDGSTIAGGLNNTTTTTGKVSSVAGGDYNTASGYASSVAGGYSNTASGEDSFVAGGYTNSAEGSYSFAGGCFADAKYNGTFVWVGEDSNGTCLTPAMSAVGQFVAVAPGGVSFFSSSAGTNTPGVILAANSSGWAAASDRNIKEHFKPVNGDNLLALLNAIPMSTWNYKAQESRFRHMGPMAQDFFAAFGLGENEKYINEIDGQGVALAGVQALYRISLEKDAQIRKLTAEVNRLKIVEQQMTALEARLARLEAGTAKPQPRSAKRTAPVKPAPRTMTLAKAQF